jgi:hypothetical protein
LAIQDGLLRSESLFFIYKLYIFIINKTIDFTIKGKKNNLIFFRYIHSQNN